MSYFDALLYGLVQGLTEYLPISSSAHLILLPKFMNQIDPGLTFDVLLHLGTLFSTLIYFRHDWWGVASTVPVLNKWVKAPKGVDVLPVQHLIVATIPAVIAGVLLQSWIREELRGVNVIAVTLIVFGFLLWFVDRQAKGKRRMEKATLKDALLVGCAQCLALIPGVSRAGSTITGARLMGFSRSDAARFSFMMSAPVIAGAVVYEMKHFDQMLQESISIGPVLVAMLAAFLSGLAAIGGLLRLIRKYDYLSFFIYRAALAVAIWTLLT